MKIPEETENSTDLSPDNTNENVNKTDRFARLLKKKEMELKKRPKFALPREKMLTKPAVAAIQPVPQGQAPTLDQVSRPVDASSRTSPPPDLEKLVGEIVQEIHSLQSADGSRHVDIQFDSKTLQGLHVHIEQRNDALAVQFSTRSDAVATLLTQHSQELDQALESRGLKVSEVAVSRTTSQPGGPYTRRGQSERGSQ
jgi:flagellar hook-length control protein FliK